ncbi:A-kinase-interacting protein 1 isoform X3 [Mus musculus]|uniref:A-kinase-interacting protein 1 isoform X3 n=1 Tax=Mus musculus TaxID=10090 RepID=UPI0005ABB26E|nr:A-kinase-interacting protein 1 isoform X3 [Mus musculus]|eukprot:XP_011240171.1 PREDICTED: A-kinase-interacting protein 1 isoform X2 [Mus musculus]
MEYCLAAAALNGVDRRSLQRSARLGREVLERAKRRAVDWHSPERSRGNVGVLYRQGPYQERWSVPGSQRLLGEKYYLSMPEEGGATHVYRYHRRKPPEMHMYSDTGHSQEQRNCRGETSVGQESIYQTSEHSQESSWPAMPCQCICPEPRPSQLWSSLDDGLCSVQLRILSHQLQLSGLCNIKAHLPN